jgi:hypothetical protein
MFFRDRAHSSATYEKIFSKLRDVILMKEREEIVFENLLDCKILF